MMNNVNILSNRIIRFGECITRKMSILAKENNALNLAQGFPEDQPPSEMIEAAIKAIRDNHNFYADMRGDPYLRNSIATNYLKYTGSEVDPDKEVTVTCGTTEAMVISLLSLINPGDEVILMEPWYENFSAQCYLSDAIIKYYTLEPPNYKIDIEELSKLFNQKTKVIIINTPNNPTGRVFSLEELEGIASLLQQYNVIALVDEIYQHITFEDNKHISFASLPNMKNRTVTINGISKAYSTTGWRVGWAIACEEITTAIRRVHDFVTATVPTPFQIAATVGLNLNDNFYSEIKERYTKRRLILMDALNKCNIPYFKPEGTYYILADISKYGYLTDEFTNKLLKEAKIAVVPGTAYFNHPDFINKYIRLTFSKSPDVLLKANEALYNWHFNNMKKS